MSAELQALARICTKPGATVDDVREACELIRRAANAEDAYVIRAGDPDFIRVGCPCDPAAYEIKQRGYWVVWQVAATNPQFAAGMFDVADRIVSGGVPIRPGRAGSHIGAILPGDDSNSELLILRGPWPDGLTAAQCEFIEAARPIIGVLVSNVLDAQRRARQREQLASLADVSRAFNETHEMDSALTSLATSLAESSGMQWVTIVAYNSACDAITERTMNRARYSGTETASRFQGTREATASELHLGVELARRGSQIIVPDVLAPDLAERDEVELIRQDIPGLQRYWQRAHVLSLAIFPIVFQEKALGYVTFNGTSPQSFDAAQVEFLKALASQAATVMQAMRLNRQLKRSQDEVRKREEWFRSLVQNASDLITVIEADTTIRYQSPSIQRILGFEADAISGKKLLEIVHPDDQAGFITTLRELMTRSDGVVTGEGRMRRFDGQWRNIEFTGTNLYANPAINGLVLNGRDVSERVLLEQQLRHQASHDPLTQLANRSRFTDHLEHALRRSERGHTQVGVLFMDLDNFKGVNDSLGHSAGDRLLTEVAERVQSCLRAVDTVARLGGDEFAILLEDVAGIAEVIAVTDRIFDSLRPAFLIDGKHLVVRASIGIAVSDPERHALNGDALLRDADTAMYVAKAHGKGRCEVFESSMQVAMLERLELLADLQRAVECHEFVLHYQPVISLASGELFGVEALVRWQHPRRGLIQPTEFISLAEESGVILALGRWILDEACRQAAAWQHEYPDVGGWTLSVNVSVKQLQHPGFVGEVEDALAASGLEPRRLILEITESVMMQDVALMMDRLGDLKALGVRLAIDDFGTGYSSLSYLRQFPFDLLKIDKSFIDDVAAVPQQKELTRAIIELGKTLDLELVAEGIENPDQLSRLQTLECELGQGFFFAKPLAQDAVADLLQKLSAAEDRPAA